MTSAIYEYIGRFVVRLAWFRFGRQIKLGGGVLAAVLTLVVGYVVAKREPPEG